MCMPGARAQMASSGWARAHTTRLLGWFRASVAPTAPSRSSVAAEMAGWQAWWLMWLAAHITRVPSRRLAPSLFGAFDPVFLVCWCLRCRQQAFALKQEPKSWPCACSAHPQQQQQQCDEIVHLCQRVRMRETEWEREEGGGGGERDVMTRAEFSRGWILLQGLGCPGAPELWCRINWTGGAVGRQWR